jgi:hypothetical protein
MVAKSKADALDPAAISEELDHLGSSYDSASENVPIIPKRIRDRVERE